MSKKENFKVDTIRGQVILFLRRLELDEVVEVEIKLKMLKEKLKIEVESKISDFGGEI